MGAAIIYFIYLIYSCRYSLSFLRRGGGSICIKTMDVQFTEA